MMLLSPFLGASWMVSVPLPTGGYPIEWRGKVITFAHKNHLQRGKAQWQLGADLLI